MNLFRTRFLSLILVVLLSAVASGVTAQDAKAAFDRYQSLYRSYQEAVMAGRDAAVLEQMAADLQAASRDYYRSIGVEVSDDDIDAAV